MKIVFTQADEYTAIFSPAAQSDVAKTLPEVEGMSELEYMHFLKNRFIPKDATNIRIVQDDEIPADRTFRDALKHDLTFDKTKCVEITKERLRREREPLLKALDLQFIRAQEENKPTANIVLEKNRLRDITSLAHEGMTLDELKNLTI